MTPEENHPIDHLVALMLDDRLSDQKAAQLRNQLEASPKNLKRYLELLDTHEALCSIYPGAVFTESLNQDDVFVIDRPTINRQRRPEPRSTQTTWPSWKWFALAASALLLVGAAGFLFGIEHTRGPASETAVGVAGDPVIAGHAMLRRSVDVRWADSANAFREGDVVPSGPMHLKSGLAEIDMFCGAKLTVEGPAFLEIESDWTVTLLQGRISATVPPAARGFTVKTLDNEIVDLGTEFAVDVRGQTATVKVIDGEVKLLNANSDPVHIVTGDKRILGAVPGQPGETSDAVRSVSRLDDLLRRHDDAQLQRLAKWEIESQRLRIDERLIACFSVAEMRGPRTIPNLAGFDGASEGTLVGPVQASVGRFGNQSRGLHFGRIGARVRTRIEGEFKAFTFATWVRIDGLNHRYNALFMGDGYENGEPHWQIRDDGRMMFSVMVDDSVDVLVRNSFRQHRGA